MKKFTSNALGCLVLGVVLMGCDKTEEMDTTPMAATQSKNFGQTLPAVKLLSSTSIARPRQVWVQ